MGYYIYDVNGYVGDLATTFGLDAFEKYVGDDDPVLGALFELGWSPVDGDLTASLDAIPKSDDPDIEEIRQAFIELAKKCDSALIISDGHSEDDDEPEKIGLATILKYSEDQARDDHGRWTTGGSGGAANEDVKPGEQGNLGLGPKGGFAHGEIDETDRLRTGSLNKCYQVHIKDDGKGLFKAEANEMKGQKTFKNWASRFIDLNTCSQAKREVLFSEINKVLGFNITPETVWKDNPKLGGGSCMSWVENFTNKLQAQRQFGNDLVGALQAHDVDTLRSMRDDVMKASIIDYVAGGCDRHAGNVGYDPSNKKLWLIDNGISLGDTAKSQNKDFDNNIHFMSGITSGRAYWGMIANDGNAQRYNAPFMKVKAIEKDYTAMCKAAQKSINNDKGRINGMFSKYKLPEKERDMFWSKVDSLSSRKVPGYVRI
jgi:hypothetical protein